MNLKQEMIKIYETYEYDWMNYLIVDDLTYHHIKKEENGGEKTLDNGALLTHRAHNYLHFIENYDKDIYSRINEILKNINSQLHKPNYRQTKKIDLLLLEFEIKYADKIIKGKKKLGKKKIKMATNIRKKEQLLKK